MDPAKVALKNTSAQPSLYCFLFFMPRGYEPGLVREQLRRGKGVFACNAHDQLSPEPVNLSSTVRSTAVGGATASSNQSPWHSWLNTNNFILAWGKVLQLERYLRYEWTVKADPDTVFFPDRIRQHLRARVWGQASSWEWDRGIYIKNCPYKFGMMGPLEVMTRVAVAAYGRYQEACQKRIILSTTNAGGYTAGEDGYITACLDMARVGSRDDFLLMNDGYCRFGSCWDNSVAAIHARKSVGSWFKCFRQAAKGAP